MRLLIVHEVFAPDFAGGGERIMLELAKNLLKKDVTIKVLTTGQPSQKYYENIRTVRLPINRYLLNFAFLRIIKEARGADVILASSYNAFLPSWLAGKILHKPVICYAMGLYGKRWLKMRGFWLGNFSRIVEKIMLNRSYNRTVFLSSYSREWGREIGIKKSTAVINPGVELKNYVPGKKEPFVLFVGRFAKQKGLDDFIAVARQLPEIKFVMIGWGEEEKWLRTVAPKNVTIYNGQKEPQKVFELYSKALVCFFPSVGETFGLVVTEAMAAGCAIISTIPLEFEGHRVEPKQTKLMTEKIEQLIEHPKIALELGRKNIILARHYSWDNCAEQFLQLFKEVLKKRKGL